MSMTGRPLIQDIVKSAMDRTVQRAKIAQEGARQLRIVSGEEAEQKVASDPSVSTEYANKLASAVEFILKTGADKLSPAHLSETIQHAPEGVMQTSSSGTLPGPGGYGKAHHQPPMNPGTQKAMPQEHGGTQLANTINEYVPGTQKTSSLESANLERLKVANAVGEVAETGAKTLWGKTKNLHKNIVEKGTEYAGKAGNAMFGEGSEGAKTTANVGHNVAKWGVPALAANEVRLHTQGIRNSAAEHVPGTDAYKMRAEQLKYSSDNLMTRNLMRLSKVAGHKEDINEAGLSGATRGTLGFNAGGTLGAIGAAGHTVYKVSRGMADGALGAEGKKYLEHAMAHPSRVAAKHVLVPAAAAAAGYYGLTRKFRGGQDKEGQDLSALADAFLHSVKSAADENNPAHISAGPAVPPDTNASGEPGGAPVGGMPQGPTGLVGSNESAMNYKKNQAYANRKSDLKAYLSEPAMTSATDSTLSSAFAHTGEAGTKMASDEQKIAAARSILSKIAERAQAL